MLSLRDRSTSLLATGRPAYAMAMQLLAMMLVIVFFQGIHFSDSETALYLHNFISGHPLGVPPGRGQSLEGVFQDVVELAFVKIGEPPFFTSVMWWIFGLCFLAGVIVQSVVSRSVALWVVVLVVAFSHMIDTIFHYIGKFDPFVIGFLWLSVSKRRSLSIAGSVLAALSHPFVALVSTLGILGVTLTIKGKLDWRLFAAVLVASGLDMALFHRYFPTVVGRPFYILLYLKPLLTDAAQYALLTLFSSIIVPISAILYFCRVPLGLEERQPLHPWGLALLLCWACVVIMIACVFTLDHTRISFLLTIAPLLLLTRLVAPERSQASPDPIPWGAFWIIFFARLTMTQAGSKFFEWHDLQAILS